MPANNNSQEAALPSIHRLSAHSVVRRLAAWIVHKTGATTGISEIGHAFADIVDAIIRRRPGR
jgi:hypothetical protein